MGDEFGLVISGFYGNGQLAMQSLQERPPQAYPNLDVKQRSLPTIPEEAWPDWANFHIIKSCGLGCWTAVQPVAFATNWRLDLLENVAHGSHGFVPSGFNGSGAFWRDSLIARNKDVVENSFPAQGDNEDVAALPVYQVEHDKAA